MSNFDHLKQLEITKDTSAEFPLPEIGENAVLVVRSATESNKPYFNALLRKTGTSGRARKSANNLVTQSQQVKDARLIDRDLFPEFVVVSWSGIFNGDGKEVKYSKAECISLFEQLPDWILDYVRLFCGNPENFIDQIDASEKGGN